MSRQPKHGEPTQVVCVRVPKSIVKKIKRIGYMENKNVSEVVVGMLKASLKYL